MMDVVQTRNNVASTHNAREINTCYHLYIFIPFFVFFFSTIHRIHLYVWELDGWCVCVCVYLKEKRKE